MIVPDTKARLDKCMNDDASASLITFENNTQRIRNEPLGNSRHAPLLPKKDLIISRPS